MTKSAFDWQDDLVIRLESARYALDAAENTARNLRNPRLAAQLAGLRLVIEDLTDTVAAQNSAGDAAVARR